MAFKNDTKDIQRRLLKVLISSKMLLRMHFHTIKEEWFTGKERKFIYEEIKQRFEDSHAVISKPLFDFAIESKIEQKYRDIFLAEWNVISGLEISESPESLMSALQLHHTGQQTFDILKEAYDALNEEGDVEKAVSVLRSKTVMLGTGHDDQPIVDITEHDDLVTLIKNKRDKPDEYSGIKTGFSKFDNKTGGLFKAEVTLFASVTGVGKSTLLKQLGWTIMQAGKNILHVTNEESCDQVRLKYHSLMTDIPYLTLKNPHSPLYKITDEQIEQYNKSLNDIKNNQTYGKLEVKEIPQFSDASLIERAFIELQNRGIRIDVVIVDYLDHMLPIVKAWGENDEQAKAAADLKGLSIICEVPVLAATQAATVAETKQDKGKKFGKMDVYGSKRKVHATNTLVYIIQEHQLETQLEEHGGDRKEISDCDWIWTLQIAKNRDGDLFSFEAQQHVATGKVTQVAQGLSKIGANSPAQQAMTAISAALAKTQAAKVQKSGKPNAPVSAPTEQVTATEPANSNTVTDESGQVWEKKSRVIKKPKIS